MTGCAAAPAEGFCHAALFYASREEFLAGTVPFVRGGLEAGEPVLVVLRQARLEDLREALGEAAGGVVFADMEDVGLNPARIIPAWQDFVDAHAEGGTRIRGIGEPIWGERSDPELAECQRHEALLNVCFPDAELTLLCPYDTAALDDAVLAEARRNHPFLQDARAADLVASADYPGAAVLSEPFDEPLPAPPAHAIEAAVHITALSWIRALIRAEAGVAQLSPEATIDLIFTVHELAANTVRHGGGTGSIRIWHEDGAVVCEVRDRGHISDPLAGRVRPPLERENGRGLWLANQLCELVQIRAVDGGTAVRVHKRAG